MEYLPEGGDIAILTGVLGAPNLEARIDGFEETLAASDSGIEVVSIQTGEDDVQKSVEEAVKDVNKKLPKYKKIRNIEISEQEFEKTTTKKIKRHANLRKKENKETISIETEE